jgi:hypothetical protein
MNELTNKLKLVMADCNNIVANNHIKNASYDTINHLVEKFITENESSINLGKINLLQKIEDDRRSQRNKKVPQITNETTKSNIPRKYYTKQ